MSRSVNGRWVFVAVGAPMAFAAAAAPLWARTAPEIQQAANDAIRRLDLQVELPHDPEPGSWSEPLLRWWLDLPREVHWSISALVVALAVGVILYTLRDIIPAWRRGRDGDWTGGAADGGEAKPQSPAAVMTTADELARQGRFVEAMHVLLLQSLADIRRHLDEQFADSLTSREILRSAGLSEDGRASLRDIISRVEWTYFGEHPAVLMDYVACRQSFGTLVETLHGRAA